MADEIKRQLIHCSGIIFSILIFFSRGLAFVLALSAFLFLFLYAYYRSFGIKSKMLEKKISLVERREEKRIFPFRGALYFFFSIMLCILLFPVNVASAAIAVLAIPDMLSTIVGIRYGRHKFFVNEVKSLEGSLAFFVSAFLILLFYVDVYHALLISLITTCVEVYPKINDNLSVPLAIGLLMVVL